MVRVTLVTNNPKKAVIAKETDTVKEILEANNITYSNAATSIDGAVLNAGEINRTLEDLGVVDKCVITVLAHKDNAAKARIVGSACVITSALTPAQIKRYEKMQPEALTMYDEDDEPVFAIAYDEEGPGSLNDNGAVFGAATDAEGHATITIVMDPANENPEELVFNTLGHAIMNLNEMEKQLLEKLPVLDELETAIRANIVRE